MTKTYLEVFFVIYLLKLNLAVMLFIELDKLLQRMALQKDIKSFPWQSATIFILIC